jgi:hypothetical protein
LLTFRDIFSSDDGTSKLCGSHLFRSGGDRMPAIHA